MKGSITVPLGEGDTFFFIGFAMYLIFLFLQINYMDYENSGC